MNCDLLSHMTDGAVLVAVVLLIVLRHIDSRTPKE